MSSTAIVVIFLLLFVVVAAVIAKVAVFWPAVCAAPLIVHFKNARPEGSFAGAVSVTFVPAGIADLV